MIHPIWACFVVEFVSAEMFKFCFLSLAVFRVNQQVSNKWQCLLFFLSQWLVDYGKLSMCALSNVDFFDIAISTAVYFLGWFLSVGLLCMLCGHVPDWVQTLLVFCSIYFNVGIGARVLDYHLASYSTWNTLLVCHVSLYGPILMKKLDLCLHGCLE